jgi:hypothetical protein
MRIAGERRPSLELAHAAAAFAACLDAAAGSRVGPAVARDCHEEGTLKTWNSIMSGLLLAPLALAGCPSDDTGSTATETTEPGTTTGDDTTGTTAAVDSSSSDGGSSSSGEPPAECPPRAEVPPAPVDCAGANGVIDTSVIIDETGMTDPSILEGVITVNGSIRISRTELTDLNFMACVRSVTGDITIFDNDMLTNVDGLWSVEDIGTDFVFSQNDALTDFNGLPNITKLINNLVMRENGALTRVSGFNNLVGIDGMGLDPEGNQIGGNITIQENPVLTSVEGLIGVLVVNGVFSVSNNPMLCLSSVVCVGEAIVQPATPPDSWTIVGNDPDC